MNYPPGMTRWDWPHVEGSEHWTGCPQFEDQPETDLPCLCDTLERMWREDAADMRADERRDERS